jgi:hypothetical protein
MRQVDEISRNPVMMIANHTEKVLRALFPLKFPQANCELQRLCTFFQSRLMLHRLEMQQAALQLGSLYLYKSLPLYAV